MLQRLELVGFKSFADRTEFAFSPGITAVVGPNGSGKSNVVDAVKWALGEQSAKALRGGEMADVIFGGSTGRRAVGMAEVSLTFDNSRRHFADEASEIKVTRRAYRGGDTEYLIGDRPARLKDVRDLLLGSGAYGIIEQGRVDALLTASAKERRAVFDEAAGISRFKAKKLEALKKLDRVDADLVRARDILRELDGGADRLRNQAAAAERHRDLSARLRTARLDLAAFRRGELCVDLAEAEVARHAAEERAEAAERAEGQSDKGRAELDEALQQVETVRRRAEAAAAESERAAARLGEAIRGGRILETGVETELFRAGKRRVQVARELRRLSSEQSIAENDVRSADAASASEREASSAASAAVAASVAEMQTLERRAEEERRQVAGIAERRSTLRETAERSKLEAARHRAESARLELTAETRDGERLESEASLETLLRAEAGLKATQEGAEQNLEEHRRYRQELIDSLRSVEDELRELRERRAAAVGRAGALEKAVSAFPPDSTMEPGLRLGAAIIAPREWAALVDLALGDGAGAFLVADEEELVRLANGAAHLEDRTHFVRPLYMRSDATGDRLIDHLGFLDEQVQAAVEQLLGNVALAPDLATALERSKENPSRRYLTRGGELVEPDGRVSVGPPDRGGYVARSSEARDLAETIAELHRSIQRLETRAVNLQKRVAGTDAALAGLNAEIGALRGERTRLDQQSQGIHDAIHRLKTEVSDLRQASDASRKQAEADAVGTREAEEEALALQTEQQRLETRQSETAAALEQAQAAWEAAREAFYRRELSAERARDRLAECTRRSTALENEAQRLRHERSQTETLAAELQSRLRAQRLAILRDSSELAEHRAASGSATAAIVECERRGAEFRELRQAGIAQGKAARNEAAKAREAVATTRERCVRVNSKLEALERTIRDECGVELSEHRPHRAATPAEAARMEREVLAIRAELESLGAVNTAAIGELAASEARASELRDQCDDLAHSHGKLQDLIARIDADSREQLLKTLESVRIHFLELFRRLFGGGRAEIILEDETDPLDSGIELRASPSGKELRSLGLMSGGERTLTAIALLLAIFRDKPSPFCILDEVDAALDEANTARLADALRQFAGDTQFIVVTHRKPTMAVADTLIGVTMQESGVSKPVAIRFEDYAEETEVRRAA